MQWDESRLKQRTVPNAKGSNNLLAGHWELFYNDKWNFYSTQTVPQIQPYLFCESTRDEKHSRSKDGTWNGGGPFLNIKAVMPPPKGEAYGTRDSGSNTWFVSGFGSFPIRYVGGFFNPSFTGDNYSDADYANVGRIVGPTFAVPNLSVWGQEAWARSAPKLEKGSAMVAVSEGIHDTAPMLRQTAKGFSQLWETMGGKTLLRPQAFGLLDPRSRISPNTKNLGIMKPGAIADQYLNQQFGWAPFVSDLGKFYKNCQDFSGYYEKLKRDNGKWKHVRRTLKDEVQRTLLASGTGLRCEPAGYVMENLLCRPGQARWEVWEEKYTLITTSGEFKYYIPDQDSNYPNDHPGLSEMYAWLTMQGLRISPSSVWRATPWTWLIDWELNIGRNLDRVTEALYDGVVSKYLYVMGHTVRDVVLYQTIPFISGDVLATFRRRVEVKQRIASGSPFGFDSPWETLTPWRLSILAALGISKGAAR